MEKVTAEQSMIEVFENDIDVYLREFQEEQEIEDMRTVPQSVWNACLMYIQRHVFTDRNLLKQNSNVHNTNSIMSTNYNMYNYDLIDTILDYYIYISKLYNKMITISGFSKLTNIPYTTIEEWGNNYKDSNRLNSKSSDLHKKLMQELEDSLTDKLADCPRNPIGAIAMLKHYRGWESPYSSDSTSRAQIGVDGLRELGQIKPPNFVQIEQKQEPTEQ